MRNQLATLGLLLACIMTIALLGLSGAVLIAATPLLLYLLGSWLFTPSVSLAVRRTLGAGRVGPGGEVTVTVTVWNNGAPLREVTIADQVPAGLRTTRGASSVVTSMDAGSQVTFSYSVAGDRGSFEFRTIGVEVAGDLPLRASRLSFDVPDELVTLPDHRALSRIPVAPRRMLVYSGILPARTGGEGTEFFDVRVHDGRGPARHVNWRLSARRPGEIYVNEFQQERVADIGIILDARLRAYPRPHGRPLFEYAASAAASLADVLLDQGNRVGFLAYGLSLDWTAPGFGRAQKQRLLTRLARVTPGESYVFHKLDAIPDRLLPGGSQLMVVSPLTGGDVDAVMRLLSIGYAVLVVSPDPISYTPADPHDPAAAAGRRIAAAERRVLIHRLRHAGIPVVSWDTLTPFDAAVTAAIGQITAAWRRRKR